MMRWPFDVLVRQRTPHHGPMLDESPYSLHGLWSLTEQVQARVASSLVAEVTVADSRPCAAADP